MSGVRLTVHRSSSEIGGNCIEIEAASRERVVLDVGRPLDAPSDAINLLPETLDLTRPAHVLVSHAHQDHYGLLTETPSDWVIHCGSATEKLIKLTIGITGAAIEHTFEHWESGRSKTIGKFIVTPHLTDHSAFDAYMLLIEVDGKRILYSGDFRRHGRKGSLIDRFMASSPSDIDVLLLEGTNLGTDKPVMPESDLEDRFIDLFKRTPGRVFVAWSAQNLDRTVTLYRACLRTARTLVVDLYTAEVLETLAAYGRIPQPDWRGIKVVITKAMMRMYRRKGRDDFVSRMARNGISARKLVGSPSRWTVMVRSSLLKDFSENGVFPTVEDSWSWSLWSGYLENENGRRVRDWFDSGGAHACHLHTSGHASTNDLQAFAAALNPRRIVPVHGTSWDSHAQGFPPIKRVLDGETLEL